MDTSAMVKMLQDEAVNYGLLIVGALLIWIVGRWIIGLVIRIVRRALTARHVDPTLQNYLASIISVTLNIILVIAILGQFGVQTTSLAALIAAMGLAIGTAWGGLLANFAAGAFMLILRPFKVGDVIAAGGTLGTVEETGLFATTIVTPDGVVTYVGNNKIFGDNIQNLSASQIRRVDRTMQVSHEANVDDVISRLTQAVASTQGVLQTPPPEIWVIDFTMAGPVIAVRPYCTPENYWTVYAAMNDVIRSVGSQAGYPAPYTIHSVNQR